MVKKRSIGWSREWIMEAMFDFVKNYPWTEAHAARAEKLFTTDPNLTIGAILMAMVDEHSVQYVEQAPVLVLSMVKRSNMTLIDQQKRLYKLAQEVLSPHDAEGNPLPKPKLTDLLNKQKIPTPLRRLSGEYLVRDHLDLFYEFAHVNPTIIAQSIPQNPEFHADWLNTLKAWVGQIKSRMNNQRLENTAKLPRMEWVITRVGQYLAGNELQVQNRQELASRWMNQIADFMLAHDAEWNDRWTLQQANDKAIKWHEELARKSNEEKFFSLHGIHWDQEIQFPDVFPKEWKVFQTPKDETPQPRLTKTKSVSTKNKVHRYNIVPVDSGKALFLEGKVMHHCVASYDNQVVKGHSYIFSVRDLDNNPQTTFELKGSAGRFTLNQQKAFCNATPEPDIQAAIRDYITRANAGKNGFKLSDEDGEQHQ